MQAVFRSRPQPHKEPVNIDIAVDKGLKPAAALGLQHAGKQEVVILEPSGTAETTLLGWHWWMRMERMRIVSEVQEGSQIAQAGILPGDTIVCAGSVSSSALGTLAHNPSALEPSLVIHPMVSHHLW